jgi:hypothetical protein
VTFTAQWWFVALPGNVSLSVRANRRVAPGVVWGDMATLPLYLGAEEDRAVEGWKVSHVPVGKLAEPGDALVVSTEPTSFSFAAAAHGASQAAPPSVKPARQPDRLPSVPKALGTVTLTGRWRYADRSGVLRDLDQQLLEIRRGDGSALSPQAYCYTEVDGTYSCSFPYTGTTVRVWARSYAAFTFGAGSTNRLGVFSGIEVTGGCGSSSIDCSYPVETAEVFCGDGQTCSVGDYWVGAGEPWLGAHQMTQDLIRSWKKIWFDVRHPASTASGPGRITYPVPAGHGTHAHVGGIVDGWISIEPPNQQAADVVTHEYGHVVMSNLWAGYSPVWPSSDCPSPHYIEQVSGPGCALSEGFADFWSWYSDQFYDGDSSTANDGPIFNWPSGASTDLETRNGYQSGDQVEGNIAAAMGDLLDGENEGPANGAGDRVTDGVQHIWHTVYTQSDSNLSQWWNAYWSVLGHEPCAALSVLQHNSIDYSLAQCTTTCFTLTRSHSGSGLDPVASPASAGGCPSGQYPAGQSIQLFATPANGWSVGSWSGTSNNTSTAISNSLIMPASNQAVAVQYIVQGDVALANGVPRDGSVAGSTSYEHWNYYYADLGSGVAQLVAELYSLSGDADLFVRFGAKPTSGTFDCASLFGGTASDQCIVPSPASGRWWIGVANFAPGVIAYKTRATWGAAAQATSLFTVAPCRVLDTRTSSPLASQVTRVVQVSGACGIPSTAKAVAVNLTVVTPTGGGRVTLWPEGTLPQVSAINFAAGNTLANNAILPLASNASGTLSAQAFIAGGGSVHLLIDVVGYFQ